MRLSALPANRHDRAIDGVRGGGLWRFRMRAALYSTAGYEIEWYAALILLTRHSAKRA
jgi:hypothetical protein